MNLFAIIAVLVVIAAILWFAFPALRPIIVGAAVAVIGFLVAALTELGNLLQGLV